MSTMNPFAYTPAQLAKALVALLTSVIAFLGFLAIVFSSGSLASVGAWAVGIGVALTPVLVFAQKTEPIIETFGGRPAPPNPLGGDPDRQV